MSRGAARGSAEAAICLVAGALALGTLAWMQALHAHVLGADGGAGATHLTRDGLLLLPLALAAALAGLRASCGLARAAVRITVIFGVLLIPATVAHHALHGADATAIASASASGAGAGMPGPHDGLTGILLHGAADALLAAPVAFLLVLGALVLLSGRRSRPFLAPARRRIVVVGSSTLVAAAAAFVVPVSGAASPGYVAFSMPLKIPPVLTGPDISIDIAQTQQQILPGSTTTMWTYNGSFPGPTIRRPAGTPTNVTFTNNLPASAGSLTVHHHGAHAPEKDDGQPASYLIAPGASRTYNYPAIEDGAPERAASQWYHDHRDGVTGRNLWMGMLGAFIYDDPLDASLNLPKGPYDVPLLVTDREFDANNQIPYTFNSGGTFGDVILVNGVPQPYYEVADRRYRFRLYNTSNRRDYTFRLGNGQAMTQIAADSGLLPAPVSRTSIRLGPAERAEVVIDFAGRLGQSIVLENADAALGPGDRDGEVMQFRVTQAVADDSSEVPPVLRPVFQTDAPAVSRVWNFDRDTTAGTWTINGRAFDPARVDARPVLGTTERWTLRNLTTVPHVAHVHLGDQKLVSRNGQPPAPYERVKDSWYLAPGDEVVVDIKFTDYLGKFILHCHVLEHEDNSMMTQFEVVPPPVGGPAPGAAPAAAAPAGPVLWPLAARPLSNRLRIVSSRRLRQILRRGLRFESAVPRSGAGLRAELRVRGRRVGVERRRRLPRGRVRVTLTLSHAEKARLTRLVGRRRRVAAELTVTSGGRTRTTRFGIRR